MKKGYQDPRLPDSFWLNVLHVRSTDCWRWIGPTLNGVPRLNKHYARRLAYTKLIGGIPAGNKVKAFCTTPLCCNPWHMFLTLTCR